MRGEGYVLSDLARSFGVAFRDSRVDELRSQVLGAEISDSLCASGGFCSLLQLVSDVQPLKYTDSIACATDSCASHEHLCAGFSESFLAQVVCFCQQQFLACSLFAPRRVGVAVICATLQVGVADPRVDFPNTRYAPWGCYLVEA